MPPSTPEMNTPHSAAVHVETTESAAAMSRRASADRSEFYWHDCGDDEEEDPQIVVW
jgi:hypothetical protein